jgi:geranylgeranyl diphosphate synthase type II
MNNNNLPSWYKDYKTLIESSIDKYLDTYLALPVSPSLEGFKQVIKYSFRWGKKLRAILALEFYLSLSWRKFEEIRFDDDIMRVCIAIEATHAYSLLHDDLPCMDNDVLRRGELTVWKRYGEYNAVLVWDLLNSLCFEIISDIKDPIKSKKISKLLSHWVGFYGMIGWQVEDLFYEENIKDLDANTLSWLHAKKTGKLIEASILSWVILSGEISNIDIYWDFWKKLGLAFQVKDDLLDVEGTPEETGKSVWWEEKWFVYLLWVETTKKILRDMISECYKISQNLGSKKIDFIVEYVETRKK